MTRSPSAWTDEDERPLPEPPFFHKLLGDLWEGLFTLVVWTLVLWLLFIPVILASVLGVPLAIVVCAFTVAPGLSGLMVSCGKSARGGFLRLGDAWRGMLHLYKQSVLLALPMVIMLALILTTANVLRAFPERREMNIVWAFQIGVGLTMVILHIYLLPTLALYDTPLKQTIGLSVVLARRFVWQTLALLATGAVLIALTTLHPLIWLFVPGVWCVIAVNATWRLARQVVAWPN